MLNFNLFNKGITPEDKIVYLDIDGVFHAPFEQGRIGNEWLEKPIELLNKLIFETNAKVIIITYRTHYIGFHNVLYDLKTSGLKADIIDYINYPIPGEDKLTFIDQKNTRVGNNILTNFSNGLENYIVIDDYPLFQNDYPTIKKRFIQTNPEIGFSEENYKKAKDLLG